MTNPLHPQEYDITRLISNRALTEDAVPHVAIPVNPEDQGLFKNEISVNSYGDLDNSLVNSAPGLWLRIGPAEREQLTDKMIRIGKVLVTDDPVESLLPSTPFDNLDSRINWTGEGWFRKSDNAYFVHNGEYFFRITPVYATEDQAGIAEFSTDQEVVEGISETTTVSPADLALWTDYHKLIKHRDDGKVIYVDQTIGDDSIENDGLDSFKPFLSLNRALLEEARQSYVQGFSNDKMSITTIRVLSGDYILDNRPGVSDYTLLSRMASDSKGPINPEVLVSLVTAVTVDADGHTVLSVIGAATAGIYAGSQVWNADSSATGIVVSVNDSQIVLRRVKGIWAEDDSVRFANYAPFNSPEGGVVVPRGCSIVGGDLRKTVVRPRYLGDFVLWSSSISETECICSEQGHTSFLLLTGSSYISGLTFADHPTIKETHHLCVVFSFVNPSVLADPAYGYYRKVYQVLGQVGNPQIIQAQFEVNSLEVNIVTDAINNTIADADQFIKINSVESSSPYISNCSVLSRFGLRGLKADGAQVGGFKSVLCERFTNVSLQSDSRAFDEVSDAPGGRLYKEVWRQASFEALNGAYMQLMNCVTIGPAVHYRTKSGGEITVSSSFVNFGDIAFDAMGHNLSPYPQDTDGVTLQLIPPKPIKTTVYNLVFANYREDLSDQVRLYVEDDELQEERVAPFKFLGGELIYLESPSGAEYTANLVDTGPFFEQDENGLWYIKVKPTNNQIYAASESLDTYFLSIRRSPDTRLQDDRIYWLQVEGMTGVRRAPQRNFVLSFNQTNPSYNFEYPLWIAKVRSTDSEGNPLNEGVYQIALLNAIGVNDSINDLYPPLDLDRPEVNPSTSKTYLAMNAFLLAIGAPSGVIPTLLSAGEDPVLLVNSSNSPQSVHLDFTKPSTIRAFGVSLDWVGHGNYSSALPKYQDHDFNLQDLFKKIKREQEAGRVYNIGMTNDGNFVVGDKVVDLTGGEEVDATMPYQETSKVFKNVTVTNRLFMYPGSRLQVSSSTIVLDADTTFSPAITTDYSTYASNTNGGFVRFATQSEANALEADNLVISPQTIPRSSTTQIGINRLATAAEARELSDTTITLTPGTLPFSSETQIGATRYATEAEANALSLGNVAVTPATLPIATEQQLGLSAMASIAEAAALESTSKVLTPGVLPYATETQYGITRYAVQEEVEQFVDDPVAVNPADLKFAYRLLKRDQIGFCFLSAGSVVPDGYLLCFGQEVSRTTYALLFNVIGTTWGDGNGSTTFNLPPADKAIVAAGALGPVGTIGGSATSTVNTVDAGAHIHSATNAPAGGHNHTITCDTTPPYTPIIEMVPAGNHEHELQVDLAGEHDHAGSRADLAGGHTPDITMEPAGGHEHPGSVTIAAGAITPTITVPAAGGHSHTYTQQANEPYTPQIIDVTLEGAHTPTVSFCSTEGGAINSITNAGVVVSIPVATTTAAGEHSHAGAGSVTWVQAAQDISASSTFAGGHTHTGSSSTWGPWVLSGYSTNPGGNFTPAVSVNWGGDHAHTGSIAEGGDHNHGSSTSMGGEHSHSAQCLEAGAHSHTMTAGGNNDGPDAGWTSNSQTVSTSGNHSHTTIIGGGGIHSHTVSISNGGGHSHAMGIDSGGGHSHGLTIYPSGDHTHVIPDIEIGSHSHEIYLSTQNDHYHDVTITVPSHSHRVDLTVDGSHSHSVTLAPASHTHQVSWDADFDHSHTITLNAVPDHAHTITIAEIPGHTHPLTIDPQNDHTHAATCSAIPDHVHDLTITPENDHDHALNIEPVLDHQHDLTILSHNGHIHTGIALSDDAIDHIHDLIITPIPGHTHVITPTAVPDHTHEITVEEDGEHNHEVTVSTMQPYMAMNVLIYTGVYSD